MEKTSGESIQNPQVTEQGMSRLLPELQTPPPEDLSRSTPSINTTPCQESQVLSVDTLTPPPETIPSPCAEMCHREQLQRQNALAIGEYLYEGLHNYEEIQQAYAMVICRPSASQNHFLPRFILFIVLGLIFLVLGLYHIQYFLSEQK